MALALMLMHLPQTSLVLVTNYCIPQIPLTRRKLLKKLAISISWHPPHGFDYLDQFQNPKQSSTAGYNNDFI